MIRNRMPMAELHLPRIWILFDMFVSISQVFYNLLFISFSFRWHPMVLWWWFPPAVQSLILERRITPTRSREGIPLDKGIPLEDQLMAESVLCIRLNQRLNKLSADLHIVLWIVRYCCCWRHYCCCLYVMRGIWESRNNLFYCKVGCIYTIKFLFLKFDISKVLHNLI